MNEGANTCRFIQTWIQPDRGGHAPQYGSRAFGEAERRNRMLQILRGTGAAPQWGQGDGGDVPALHQDANVFVSEADAGHRLSLPIGPDRQAYLLCIEGGATVGTSTEEVTLVERDAVEVLGGGKHAAPFELVAGEKGVHVLVVEMKKTRHQADK